MCFHTNPFRLMPEHEKVPHWNSCLFKVRTFYFIMHHTALYTIGSYYHVKYFQCVWVCIITPPNAPMIWTNHLVLASLHERTSIQHLPLLTRAGNDDSTQVQLTWTALNKHKPPSHNNPITTLPKNDSRKNCPYTLTSHWHHCLFKYYFRKATFR